jgi:hypothetical protein
VLSRLKPDDLNALLTKNSNTILKLLVEAAQNKHAEFFCLTWVLSKLDPGNLNAVPMNNNDTILNLLVKEGTSED